MNHALRYFISLLSCFVRRNKKRWTVGFAENDTESPGRAQVPGAKQIQMSVRVQVESTCTVVVFLVRNFSCFFNSLTPSFFPPKFFVQFTIHSLEIKPIFISTSCTNMLPEKNPNAVKQSCFSLVE